MPAVGSTSAPRRTRTYNPLIKSQGKDFVTSDPAITSGDHPAAHNSSPNSSPQTERVADARLAQVIDAWDALPEAVRAGILAMVASVAPSRSK